MKIIFFRGMAVGAALIVCVIFSGCVRKTSGTEVVGVMATGPDGQPELNRAIIANNTKLGRTIQVVDVRHEYVGDVLKAHFTLASTYAATISFQYKFAWYNEAGLEVHPNTDAWTPAVLHGMETISIQGVAPDALVKSFKVKIRN
ncbi:MAG: YcfL family protein [Kiritimatiellia bacterium]